jgi:hypothetical protein
MPKIFPYFGKFPIASTMLTSSVLIALSMTLDTAVLAQPTKAPIPTPAPTNQPTKVPIATPSPTNQPTSPIAQKLLGKWQSKDPSSDVALTFVFSPDGKLYILSPNSQKPMAVEFKYSINPTPQPMHLDITDPGQLRPTAFSPTATLFTKVSDNTKLPENVKIIDLRL